jgi:hypothetical protein
MMADPLMERESPPSTVNVALGSTVKSRQLTVPAPAVEGAFGVPAGITALIEELGTPALQLRGSFQLVLSEPSQVVWALAAAPSRNATRHAQMPLQPIVGLLFLSSRNDL